jgi:AcrR family transcriptional regulator
VSGSVPAQPETGIPRRQKLDEPAAGGRERIMRTACDLFSREGIAAVGVDRIVAEAGVAKTTLYRHFRSPTLGAREPLRSGGESA